MHEISLIAGVDIYTPHKLIRNGAIAIKNGKILYAGPKAGMAPRYRGIRVSSLDFLLDFLDSKKLIAVPGFIDIHVHGGGGADFMDGTTAAAATVLEEHLNKGTTSAAPTLMTAADKNIRRAIDSVLRARRSEDALPDILGLHLEGPYIAKKKRGAQPEKYIRPFVRRELAGYIKASAGTIKIVTLAPEMPGAGALIRFLKRKNIIAAAGHSGATYELAEKGLREGISHGTHLFNAMSGLFHRDPGLAGALLMDDGVSVELIADGIHLHPAILRFVTRIKPLDKIILVTDATRWAGLSKNPLKTADGKLYGSAITLDIALRNMVAWTGRPLTDLLPMVTSNPARLLGVSDSKGVLKKGADADIVLLDCRLNVKAVFRAGKRIQ